MHSTLAPPPPNRSHPPADRTKYKVHDDYPFADARALFLAPPVASADDCDVNYKDPDEAGVLLLAADPLRVT